MTPKEAKEKYGKKIWRKMQKYLNGITVAVLPDRDIDIPEEDLENAYKELKGEKLIDWD
jgi:hypothetical protein